MDISDTQETLTKLTSQVFQREQEFIAHFEIAGGCELDYFYMSGSKCLVGLDINNGLAQAQTTISTSSFLGWIK